MSDLREAPTVEILLEQVEWVKSLARSLVLDPDRADDLAQATWLQALESPPRNDRNLRGWLATIARNLARQTRRTDMRRRLREETVARPAAEPDSADLVHRAMRQREIVGHVLALEEPYRTTVLQRFFDGLEADEIAARQSVPLATVRTRLQRALARLRERMDREWGDRRSWCAALLPLARPSSKDAALSTTSATSLAGAILALAWKLGLVVLVAGAAWWGVRSGRARSAEGAIASRDAAGAHGVLSRPAPSTVLAIPPGTGRAPAVADRQALAPASAASPALGRTRLAGRIVDTSGRPVTGVPVVGRDEGLPRLVDGWIRMRDRAVQLVRNELELYRQSPEALDEFARGMGDPPGLREILRGEDLAASGRTRAGGEFDLDVPGEHPDLEIASDGWALLCRGRPKGTQEILYVVAPAVALAGRVVDTAGAPLPHVELHFWTSLAALPEFPFVLEDEVTWDDCRTTSDASGGFRLPRVPRVGNWPLTAYLKGFESDPVPVPAGGAEDVLVVMRRAAEPRRPFIRGRVLDELGRPFAGAGVQFGQDSSKSDDGGGFEIRLTVSPDPETALTAMGGGHAPAVREDVAAELAAHPAGVEDVLLRLGGPPLSISGRVFDVEGRPCSDWRVDLDDPIPYRTMYVSIERASTGQYGDQQAPRTDGEGRFRLDGLRDRTYRVRAWDERSCLVILSDPVAAGTRDFEIRVPSDAILPRIQGRVVSRRGAPVADAKVAITYTEFRIPGAERSRRCRGTRTDAAGRFELVDVPRRGTYLSVDGAGIEDFAQHEIPQLADAETEIVVTILCRFRLEPRETDSVDAFELLDASGERLEVVAQLPGGTSGDRRVRRLVGGFPVCEVSEEATTIVLFEGNRELRRASISLQPGALQAITP